MRCARSTRRIGRRPATRSRSRRRRPPSGGSRHPPTPGGRPAPTRAGRSARPGRPPSRGGSGTGDPHRPRQPPTGLICLELPPGGAASPAAADAAKCVPRRESRRVPAGAPPQVWTGRSRECARGRRTWPAGRSRSRRSGAASAGWTPGGTRRSGGSLRPRSTTATRAPRRGLPHGARGESARRTRPGGRAAAQPGIPRSLPPGPRLPARFPIDLQTSARGARPSRARPALRPRTRPGFRSGWERGASVAVE